MREYRITGATDVTGFGLLGHAWELARASKVTLDIESASVPVITGALELAGRGIVTRGDKSNRKYAGENAFVAESVDRGLRSVIFDPQTAGGMLMSVPSDKAQSLLEELREHYPAASVIGNVVERGTHAIRIQ